MSGRVPGQVPEEIINAMHSTMAQSALAAQIAQQHAEQQNRQAVLAAGTVIMAPPPTLAAGSPAAPPVRGYTRRNVHVAMPAEPEAKPAAAMPQRPPVFQWLDGVAFFIPKSIREPFLGDLREDLADMAAKGRSPATVRWAAISQVVVLVLQWAWSSVVRR